MSNKYKYFLQVNHPTMTNGKWVDHSQRWFTCSDNLPSAEKLLEDFKAYFEKKTEHQGVQYRIICRTEKNSGYNHCSSCRFCKDLS